MNFETNVFEKVLKFLQEQQPVSVSYNALIYYHLHFRMRCYYPFLLCIIFTSFLITVAILDFRLIYSMSVLLRIMLTLYTGIMGLVLLQPSLVH
jgi:hypothetical protein